jgi:hypothetical protein
MLTGDPGQSDKVSGGDVALLTASARLHAFGGQLGDLAGGVVEPQLHGDAGVVNAGVAVGAIEKFAQDIRSEHHEARRVSVVKGSVIVHC